MDVPNTVETALADQPVAGRNCLEAGAGVGNTTAGLLERGADTIQAITDDRDHARAVRDRFDDDRVRVLEADLRSIPLDDDTVEFVTAHALFNVVPVGDVASIVSELSRVAAPGGHLVADDYAPMPKGPMAELFAVENALAELVRAVPTLTFYPAPHLRSLFADNGWTFDRQRSLLDPVPWTESHVRAHLDVARELAAEGPEDVTEPLVGRAERLADAIGSAEAGEMYSLAFRR
jgi:SAM-dependent methyltransferase